MNTTTLRRQLPMLLVAAVVLGACGNGVGSRASAPAIQAGGDPGVGREAIARYGCGACHRIPGIPNARALVGPPLDSWSRRSFIAGTLANSEENLTAWLLDPDAVRPGTAMPDVGLSEGEAADVVAYLFTLD